MLKEYRWLFCIHQIMMHDMRLTYLFVTLSMKSDTAMRFRFIQQTIWYQINNECVSFISISLWIKAIDPERRAHLVRCLWPWNFQCNGYTNTGWEYCREMICAQCQEHAIALHWIDFACMFGLCWVGILLCWPLVL